MDLGFQLGRRFRGLKLWMVIRAFGVEGIRRRIRAHCAWAARLAERIAAHPDFELAAPVPFSTVCFRLRRRATTPTGACSPRSTPTAAFSSPTRCCGDRFVLRAAIGNLRTTEEHVEALWRLLTATAERLAAAPAPARDGGGRGEMSEDAYRASCRSTTERLAPEEMERRARAFYAEMDRRRSVRDFAPDPVPRHLIELAIRTASTAPSGAHRQPWRFVAVVGPGDQAAHPRGGGGRGARELRGRPLPRGVAARARPARHDVAEAPPRDGAVAGGGLRGAARLLPGRLASARTTTSRRASASPAACSSPRSTTWAW